MSARGQTGYWTNNNRMVGVAIRSDEQQPRRKGMRDAT